MCGRTGSGAIGASRGQVTRAVYGNVWSVRIEFAADVASAAQSIEVSKVLAERRAGGRRIYRDDQRCLRVPPDEADTRAGVLHVVGLGQAALLQESGRVPLRRDLLLESGHAQILRGRPVTDQDTDVPSL